MSKVFYVVHKGRIPGIYTKWDDCKKQVEKFDGAEFKKFDNREDAETFLEKGFGRPRILSKSEKIKKAVEAKNEKNMESMLESDCDKIYIYTDGSLIRHGKEVSSGYGYYIPTKNIKVSKQLLGDKITNNRAELTAIIEAVETLNEEDKKKMLCIFTDSQYSIYLFTGTGERYEKNGWKNEKKEDVPNIDLIQKLLKIKRSYQVTLLKVRAHTEAQDEHSLSNSIADRLANDAAQKGFGKKEMNPFTKKMFGYEFNEEEYKKNQQEDKEGKLSKQAYESSITLPTFITDEKERVKEMKKNVVNPTSMFDLFENYDTSKSEPQRPKPEKKKNIQLKNTSLKSWFLDSE